MILHRYFARRYLQTLVVVGGLFFLLVVIADLIEQGRAHGGDDVGFGQIVTLTLMNAPSGLYELMPLLVMLTTIAFFLALARSSEMVVTRASGRSALRALAGPLVVVVSVGLLSLAILNPLVAATQAEYDARVSELEDSGASVLSVDASGLWLRQGGDEGQSVIRAARANGDGTRLSGVTFVTFAEGDVPTRRIDATRADLTEGAWVLTDAKSWPLGDAEVPEAEAERHEALSIPTSLTADQIRDSFGAPSQVPVWELPGFIRRLEAAGFSGTRHRMHFQSELAQPAFLVAMLLICAVFTLRHHRGGRTGISVLAAIGCSFALYFIATFAQVLGETGQIPVWLAAWAPPLAGIALGLAGLLHLEDG